MESIQVDKAEKIIQSARMVVGHIAEVAATIAYLQAAHIKTSYEDSRSNGVARFHIRLYAHNFAAQIGRILDKRRDALSVKTLVELKEKSPSWPQVFQYVCSSICENDSEYIKEKFLKLLSHLRKLHCHLKKKENCKRVISRL